MPQSTTEESVTPTFSDEDDPSPRNELGIHLGEHWGIVGATGTGKTYFTIGGLLAFFAEMYPNAKRYVLDSTDDPAIHTRIAGESLHAYGNNVPDLLRSADRSLIWTPRNTKIPRQYAEWFRRLNDARESQVVVIDEAASITKEAEEELEALLKQLRKHGGTVIVLTQQIAKINTTLFSQMTHYVQFSMGRERYDLAQARSYLNIDKDSQRDPLHKYGFFYRKVRGQEPMVEYSDMYEFFSKGV